MNYDIVIVGGGMVGATLAYALRETTLRILLIDATPLAATDARQIAITYPNACFFKNCGLWSALSAHAEPIQQVHVSHRGFFEITRLTADELNIPALGYVIPAKVINSTLQEHLDQTKIEILRPAQLENFLQNNHEVTVSININGVTKTLQTKWLIAADGNHSTVRELLGIPTKKIDYEQTALVTITELQRPHQQIAYERFIDQGAIAMLPLSNNRCATIWTETCATINELLALDDKTFLARLQKKFGYRLGRFEKTHTRVSYPLQFIQATQQIHKNIVLIGNAAHALHPIAAQGFNLALYEIAALTEFFLQDEHTEEKLAVVFKPLKQQQNNSMRFSHSLSALFSKQNFLFNIMRRFGMISLNTNPLIKKYFANAITGRSQRLSKLLIPRE